MVLNDAVKEMLELDQPCQSVTQADFNIKTRSFNELQYNEQVTSVI